MLKTSPLWAKWKVNSNDNTCPSRVDTQQGDGADNSAPEPDVLDISNEVLNAIQEYIGKTSDDDDDEQDYQEPKPTRKVKKKTTLVNKRLTRVNDTPIEYLDENQRLTKNHRLDGWKLDYVDCDDAREGNKHKVDRSFSYRELRNKKLSSTLSLLFGKVAEERMGDKTEGSDKWDINKIMFRRISKKIITDCKYSREKKQLVLMLDSSPSCRNMAREYSKIATESARFDDVEIYDAPNGYAHSVYDARTKKFRTLEREELDYTYRWNGFSNRTIIYFGDNDARESIVSAYKYNDIHWFFQRYDSDHYTKQENQNYINSLRKHWDGKVTVYSCNDTSELITAVRDMR